MLTKLTQVLSILAATTIATIPASSFASTPPTSNCLLHEQHVTSVRAYRVAENLGKASVQRLRGAELFVQAKPGLTAEWLQLNLARHVTQMRGPASMPDCALDVDDLTVRVFPSGTGYRVRIIARDTGLAREVLRRASLLVT